MKLARHAQILKLIQEYHIETQEELAERLNEKGFSVTQATVSRDIRQLQLTKVSDGNGHSRYALTQRQSREQSEKYVRVLRDALVSAEPAGNLVVIKTVAGMAMAAAAALDEMNWQEIVGCVAGDNTIFCAVRNEADAAAVSEKVSKILES